MSQIRDMIKHIMNTVLGMHRINNNRKKVDYKTTQIVLHTYENPTNHINLMPNFPYL